MKIENRTDAVFYRLKSRSVVYVTLAWVFLLSTSASALEPIPLPAGARLADKHNGYDYQPFQIRNARLIPRISHLQPQRDWERMDVYIPESASVGEKLPCIVNVYGGGYGEKGVGTIRGITQTLVDHGYVVVTPDYALQVEAPEAIAAWDVAAAVRHVRAHADRYNVDPERIGMCGWSAGGWIAQFIGYAGPTDIRHADRGRSATPTIEPHPLLPDQPITLQAVVTDWGAGKLTEGNPHRGYQPSETISPDDPPLLTCYDGRPRKIPQSSVQFLRDVGVPAETAFLGDVKSTHVPKFTSPGWNTRGEAMTWEEAICEFFDHHVKKPRRASPPQVTLALDKPSSPNTTVRLLNVHGIHTESAVHCTLDGSLPTTGSPIYERPIELQPGQTIRAIATRLGLMTSAVASHTAATLPRPVITIEQSAYDAKVGEPFRVQFEAKMPEGTTHEPQWIITGRTGNRYRTVKGGRPKTYPWMQIVRNTGELTGVPRQPGIYPIIVSAVVSTTENGKLQRDKTVADALLIVVTVTE